MPVTCGEPKDPAPGPDGGDDLGAATLPKNAVERKITPLRYADVYAPSLQDPESFWAEAAHAIDWIRPWHTVLDRTREPFYRWFAGGLLIRASTLWTVTSFVVEVINWR